MNRLVVTPGRCRPDDLAPAVEWLKSGRIVAFPTDTVYGLAVDPTSASAVQQLFDLKGRDPIAAVPLVAASLAQVEASCGRLAAANARLAAAFWPGPLSLIVEAPAQVTAAVHGGLNSIAIRVPAAAAARVLCEAWGGPLTATSANRSGEPPARSADDLRDLANDARVLVVDAGAAPGGPPSTLVDARGDAPVLVRAGAVPWERVLTLLQA
jgi:L-threonylcarbamoyladenylate synthase